MLAMEAENVKGFVALFEGHKVVNNSVVRRSEDKDQSNGRSGGTVPPSWGSQQFRIFGAIILLLFIVIFAAAALMLYIKTSVEGRHRRRKVGEGYIKVSPEEAKQMDDSAAPLLTTAK